MAEPSPKRIKTDPVKSGEDGLVPVTVEFKFCSCKTSLLGEGNMTGQLHVPMLQNPSTGRFRIPAGTTKAKGKAKFKDIRFQGRNERNFENSFTATFERPDPNAPIEDFKLGYRLSGEQDVDSGFHPHLLNSEDDRDGHCYSEFETCPANIEGIVDREPYRKRLNDWQSNAGGMLTNFAKGDVDDTFLEDIDDDMKEAFEDTVWQANYKIKLYTTLSAHSPNETNLVVEDDAVPQWERLEQLMIKRFPARDASWCKRAVKNYIYFLDSKKEHADWNSELFSPSKWVDEVWHAHLSFTERYQHDMLAYCGHIIVHSPVLGARALRQYHAAYDKHVARVEQLNEYVDSEFWPKPKGEKRRFDSQEQHDGDSDDCCYLPNFSSCG